MAKSMKATNQNFGAIIRIRNNATARCTRQCASNGSAQPCRWSLPIAIQEFCSKKSATMCLAVSNSIHPTSAPTGTVEDIVGSNKADASIDWTWGGENFSSGGQLDFLFKPDVCLSIGPFMTNPGMDCTSGGRENSPV